MGSALGCILRRRCGGLFCWGRRLLTSREKKITRRTACRLRISRTARKRCCQKSRRRTCSLGIRGCGLNSFRRAAKALPISSSRATPRCRRRFIWWGWSRRGLRRRLPSRHASRNSSPKCWADRDGSFCSVRGAACCAPTNEVLAMEEHAEREKLHPGHHSIRLKEYDYSAAGFFFFPIFSAKEMRPGPPPSRPPPPH